MNEFTSTLQQFFHLSLTNQHKTLSSIIVLAVLWIIRAVIIRLIHSSITDPKVVYRWRKTVAYASYAIGILIVARIWFEGIQAISTFLGLLSAGLAIALRNILVDIAAWVFILTRRPFEVGDRIQIGTYAGDVIDLRIFQFTLLEIGNWVEADQSTGRILHIPNGKVFSEVLANYNAGFQYIWNEIRVLVTFESDWKKAKATLLAISQKHSEHLTTSAERQIKEAARKFMIFYRKLTPTVYTDVKESGVQLTIRYLCDPRNRRSSSELIWEDILTEFSRMPDIDFAYPTVRYYDNQAEGSTNAGNAFMASGAG